MIFNFNFNRSDSAKESFKALSRINVYNQMSSAPEEGNMGEEHPSVATFFPVFSCMSRQVSERPALFEISAQPPVNESSTSEGKSDETVEERGEEGDQNRLIAILRQIFKGESLAQSDQPLDKRSLQVLIAIIERKFGKKLRIEEDQSALLEQISKISLADSKKRPEENSKFVFKQVLKVMREKFKARTSNKRCKKVASERAFYSSYFDEAARAKNVPIDAYFHPRNVVGPASIGHKNINSDYIRTISENPKFIEDFQFEMSEMRAKWKNKIDSKLKILQNKIEEAFAAENQVALHDLVSYISKNSKCKLPWTVREVHDATSAVQRLLKPE